MLNNFVVTGPPLVVAAWVLSMVTSATGTTYGRAADAPADVPSAALAGKALFRQQCTICHSAEGGDEGGALGPSLAGVFGRRAASSPGFAYSAALEHSALTWDGATLKRFLMSPSTVVPGTAMLVAVPAEMDRNNLVAYLLTLKSSANEVPAAAASSADWKLDEPGRVHRINIATLPAPFATLSSRNGPSVEPQPANAILSLPAGFKIEPYATALLGPRKMLVAANGDILVSETRGGRISVLHPSADGTHAGDTRVYALGLKQPFGIAFYPNADQPRWLYVAETHRVVRYAYQTGDMQPRGSAEVVVAQLPSGGGHFTRDIAFSPDGRQLFVSVGSASNVAETMSKKTPDEIKIWESQHGMGAAWDQETDRADVLVFDAAAPSKATIYAAGIRNCVSLTVQPATGELWCTTNERDALGDDLVPDYSTRITRGSYYGWPWYYMGGYEDPRLKGDRPDLKTKVSIPDVPYQAHSAALNLVFYTASTGKSAFPAAYVGDGFAAFHGSWNRSLRTGYKLVRVRMKNGEPTGDYEDFLTGFIVDNGDVWGRPVATTELKDGSLLLSDDAGDVIFRISYARR